MAQHTRRLCPAPVLGALAGVLVAAPGLAGSENLLKNPSFEEGPAAKGVPAGWHPYAGRGENLRLSLVSDPDTGRRVVLIEDANPEQEIGLTQTVTGEPGMTYEASVDVKAAPGASTDGAYLQMRFLPSNKLVQTALAAAGPTAFNRVSVRETAPPGTKDVQIYLYTHAGPTPKVIVDSAALVSGVEPAAAPAPQDTALPDPPVYAKLKPLHVDTHLVRGGKPNAAIVAPAAGLYADDAKRIQAAIRGRTGITIPVVSDDSPQAAVPVKGNLIALGNRSTNKTIEELYNRFYTLLDLRYPGPGGHVLRTLHNPFGDGFNVIFAGGSDAAGVTAAADLFVRELQRAPAAGGSLTLGRLAEIQLGGAVQVPTDPRKLEIWEASKGYGSTGYFGWNSLSKHMAAYYMTGDAFHAREFLRLAFPDAAARKQISEIDQERIENKDEPLSGPYHYNAHMMILFWDLIEESPVFSDEVRLRVTNAFAKQLHHRVQVDFTGKSIWRAAKAPGGVGSRHGQWGAISLYCLARYFQKDYPGPIWERCERNAKLYFDSLHHYAWVAGESDNLFWYNTGIAPIFTYLVLTGDRKPVENGALRTLLLGQEILINGRARDSALNSASIGYLHKAAYLLQDGRYIHYRDLTGLDMNGFRLGQSFWPEPHLAPKLPEDLVGRWSVHAMPEPAWRARRNGFDLQESFYFASYRSAADASGDFVLLDGFNGASRNPYHTFAILQLRLEGDSLLNGYGNQLLTRVDGLVEPKVAMNAALKHRNVVGPTAVAVGEVPDAAYCNWRRTLAQRTGRYALVVDDLAFRTDSRNIEVQIKWEGSRIGRQAVRAPGVVRLRPLGKSPGADTVRSLDQACTTNLKEPDALSRLENFGITLLRSRAPGAWLEMPFVLNAKREGEVFAELLNYTDRGGVRLFLDGKLVCREHNHYAAGVARERVPLGRHDLAPGEHRLRVETVAARAETGACNIGLIGLSFQPANAPAAQPADAFDVSLCDPAETATEGQIATMTWLGAAQEGQHRLFFSLVARNAGDSGTATTPVPASSGTACARVAENAAALALPAPALAVAGQYRAVAGELVVLGKDHLFGKALTKAGALLRASASVCVDWDFANSRLELVAQEPAVVHLALDSGAGVRVDGQPCTLRQEERGVFVLQAGPGRHIVENASPAPAVLHEIGGVLDALLAEGRRARAGAQAAAGPAPAPQVPALRTAFSATLGGRITDLVTIPASGGPLLAAAEGQSVHLLGCDGKERATFATDGRIRMLRWWHEYDLLLAGCADEQVIAFDRAGKRRWVFTSVMDPEVFRAAKQYWFKSAPGHEGIHGLYTGVFLDGKSQAFVGSACTLEILDEHGQLIKRMPQFWGDPSTFAIIDGPDGSLNLLAARKTNGNHGVRVINNRKLNPGWKGFDSVPKGHSYVGGWSSLNRHHLFYEDLDGDGVKEVVSEINGTWNRVTVWTAGGKALYDASFGPGRKIQARNMRDLDIADLDGDGKKEILAATSSGLLVALDGQCRKRWAIRLPAAPEVIKCVTPPGSRYPWIVVGCEDGRVLTLDASGAVIRRNTVEGSPTCIAAVNSPAAGPGVLLATHKGNVVLLALGP
ncbi:MAG: hypothetical protein JXR37_03475 [Kiritimatiellae bacterium]|nr:hypothetical protein [Kiritimatiellia bacterium]